MNSDNIMDVLSEDAYASLGGTKLRLVHPNSAVDDFDFMDAPGAIRATLAPFGRFQTGISMQAPVYKNPLGIYGCEDLKIDDDRDVV